MTLKNEIQSWIRGWFPHEPSLKIIQKTDRTLTNAEKRMTEQKYIALCNAGVLAVFLGVHFLIDPFNKSVTVSIGFWITFLPTVILVNYLLYRRSRKKANLAGANLR
jgi:hypothetical protein